MSSVANALNLRPQEKRVIVALGVIVFVILNIVLVFPHFQDWNKINKDLGTTQNSIAIFQAVIDKDNDPGSNGWHNILKDLRKTKDGTIPTFSEIALQETVTAEARRSGVAIQSYAPTQPMRLGPASQADKFFESESVRIAVQSTEEALVNFLYNIGNDPAMIRVHDLTLHPPDANRYGLAANITLTADYQKNVETNAPPRKEISEGSRKTATPPGPIVPVPPMPGNQAAPTRDVRSGNNRANPIRGNTNNPARRGPTPPAMPNFAPPVGGGPRDPSLPTQRKTDVK